ncbi:MAG: membrane protein insertase YidC [Deltaproteobacteria bacterium]|nr:membrane protein insertase YidC [Deltaproteobacteria bacterium]
MEKRALLAFVLSLLVLVFWQFFFTPDTKPPEKTPHPPSSAPEQEKAPVPDRPLGAVASKPLPKDPLVQTGLGPEKWEVESPLYIMQILSPGARIKSNQLRQYRQEVAKDSPPMEMVPTQASGYLPFAVDLLQHQDWQLSTRPFKSQAPDRIALKAGEPSPLLAFQTEVPDRIRLTKTFHFSPDSYVIDIELQLQNLSHEKLTDQLGISFYAQPFSTGGKDQSWNPSSLAYFEKGSTTTLDLKEMLKKEVVVKPPLDWIGYQDSYFIQAIIPLEKSGYQIVPRVLDAESRLMQIVYLTDPFQLDSQEEKTFKLRLYIGPKELGQLAKAENRLQEAVDYGWFSILAKPSLYLLNWLYKYTHNYGVAIILLTILIKIIFWPLTQKSYQSMQAMKKIQPKIAQVREKFKDDREKLNQELMNLYRTYKVNPMGGCLPMLLQIPVFIALYRMLYGSVELRHQPFMLWINDLTAPDRLDVGFRIPYLSGDPGLPILTILMGATMFIQQKMTPSSGDPRQEQIMLLMPVVFTFFFLNFPSGLVLYWLINNILSIVQQYWINRHA